MITLAGDSTQTNEGGASEGSREPEAPPSIPSDFQEEIHARGAQNIDELTGPRVCELISAPFFWWGLIQEKRVKIWIALFIRS